MSSAEYLLTTWLETITLITKPQFTYAVYTCNKARINKLTRHANLKIKQVLPPDEFLQILLHGVTVPSSWPGSDGRCGLTSNSQTTPDACGLPG